MTSSGEKRDVIEVEFSRHVSVEVDPIDYSNHPERAVVKMI